MALSGRSPRSANASSSREVSTRRSRTLCERVSQERHKPGSEIPAWVKFRVEDRELQALGAAGAHRRSNDRGEFLPRESVRLAIVHGRHQRVVENVGVDVDPETVELILRHDGEGVIDRSFYAPT